MSEKTHIERLMDSAEWTEVTPPPTGVHEGLPYATHEGVFWLGGYALRCYRLNTGESVFNTDDVDAFFAGAMKP